MSSDSFVHLHTHSEYSLLDGASRVEELCAKAAEFGMPAIALTDHGAMFGTLDFYEAARRHGIKPIIGVEAYVAPGKRFDRTPGESEEKYRHLTLLARSEEGYRNLLRLVTDAHLEGFWHRPRIDKELLAERSKGLIGLSGCLASETARLLLAGQELKARDVVATYRDILGPEGFYLEVQDHGLPEQARVNPMLVDLSKATGIPLAATNDIHYTEREHARPHDVLLCIQQQKVLTDTNRLKFDTDEFFLKPSAQMRKVFAALPEACDATLGIAEACELDLRFGELHLPRFDPPAGKTLDGYLRELVEEGARKRYGTITEEVRQRFDSELLVIEKMGFSGYFLIVWDLIRFARDHGIRVGPGRGSAAGSVVSYCLQITDLDPLRYGLIFERFLNPERKQMPDIDMDFDERRRDEVIRYVAEKYGGHASEQIVGNAHVAQIITFQTIKGKQGIRDAARVLGFPPMFGDRLCKMYPPALLGRDYSIDKALELSSELGEAYQKEPEAKEVIDAARALEGSSRVDDLLGLRYFLVGLAKLRRQLQGLVDRVVTPQERGRIHLAEPVAKHGGESKYTSCVPNSLLTLDCLKRDDLGDMCVPNDLLGGMTSVLFRDVPDDLVAPALVEVHVDVGHLLPLGVEEPFEDEPIAQRIEVRDLEAVADNRPGGGSASRPHADAVVAGEPDEVPHDQEVAGEPHLLDDQELGVEPLADLFCDGPVAFAGALLDQLPEVAVQRLSGRRIEPGQVQLAEAQVELARLGDAQGRVAGLGQRGEDLPHLGGWLQEELVGVELQPVGVCEDLLLLDAQQHVVGPGMLPLCVVDVVGRRERDPCRLGQVHQHRVDPGLFREAVVLDLEIEAFRSQDVPVGSHDVAGLQLLSCQQEAGRLGG